LQFLKWTQKRDNIVIGDCRVGEESVDLWW